jgi:hypothetical protein
MERVPGFIGRVSFFFFNRTEFVITDKAAKWLYALLVFNWVVSNLSLLARTEIGVRKINVC